MSRKPNLRTDRLGAHLWGDFPEGEGGKIGLFSTDLVQKRHICHQRCPDEVEYSRNEPTIDLRDSPPAQPSFCKNTGCLGTNILTRGRAPFSKRSELCIIRHRPPGFGLWITF